MTASDGDASPFELGATAETVRLAVALIKAALDDSPPMMGADLGDIIGDVTLAEAAHVEIERVALERILNTVLALVETTRDALKLSAFQRDPSASKADVTEGARQILAALVETRAAVLGEG